MVPGMTRIPSASLRAPLRASLLLALTVASPGWAASPCSAQEPRAAESEASARPELAPRRFEVGETERWALIRVPQDARRRGDADEATGTAVNEAGAGAPLVLVFHGHGGTARQIARRAPLHQHWPEAVVVYPQGLRTPGALTDPEGKRFGWQHGAGDQGDRDLAFVDLLLDTLCAELRIDPDRVHATGHSNGGGFSYLLWAERGERFASFAPSAAAAGKALRGQELVPRPVLHFGSPDDALVKWSWQQRTLGELQRRFDCGLSEAWKPVPGVVRFPSPRGGSVYLLEHEGGHRMFEGLAESAAAFFRLHPRPKPPAGGSGHQDLDGGRDGEREADQEEDQAGSEQELLPQGGTAGLRAGGAAGPARETPGATRHPHAGEEQQGHPGGPGELVRPVGAGQVRDRQQRAGQPGGGRQEEGEERAGHHSGTRGPASPSGPSRPSITPQPSSSNSPSVGNGACSKKSKSCSLSSSASRA